MSLAWTFGGVRPQSWQSQDVLQRIADDDSAFFAQASDPNPTQDLGLLRPRFGLPAIASIGAPFEAALLQRGEPSEPQLSLVRDGPSVPLRILSQRREPVAAGVVRLIVSVEPAVAESSWKRHKIVCCPSPLPWWWCRVTTTWVISPRILTRGLSEPSDASRSLRVLHLSGHTHWADVFEA